MTRALEILVVEDEVEIQRLVDVVFRVAAPGGFLVRRAGSLEEAIRAVTGMMPDLVLLDLHLPDAQGLEATTSAPPAGTRCSRGSGSAPRTGCRRGATSTASCRVRRSSRWNASASAGSWRTRSRG